MEPRLDATRDLGEAKSKVADGLPVRTKPQAPRTLNCAIRRQYGPNKFAISALRCKVTTHLLSAGSDSKSIDSPRLRQTPAASFLPPNRKRLAQSVMLSPQIRPILFTFQKTRPCLISAAVVPIMQLRNDPVGNRNGSHMSALAQQVDNRPVFLPAVEGDPAED
jgi:hypothetical protein